MAFYAPDPDGDLDCTTGAAVAAAPGDCLDTDATVHPDAEEIVQRTVYALINEGMDILNEGIAQRPGDIDIVYVYGYGFPAWRGGPMHYADTVGLPAVLASIEKFAAAHGEENWKPSPLLKQLVEDGKSLADWAAERG